MTEDADTDVPVINATSNGRKVRRFTPAHTQDAAPRFLMSCRGHQPSGLDLLERIEVVYVAVQAHLIANFQGNTPRGFHPHLFRPKTQAVDELSLACGSLLQ